MRRILLPLALLPALIFLASCQKEIEIDLGTTGGGGGAGGGGGTGSGYYIKFKKDGVDKNYTNYSGAHILPMGFGATGLSFTANANPGTTNLEGISLNINFFNGAQPGTGTFSEEDVTMDHIVAGVYNPNSTTLMWAAGLFTPSIKPLKITILTKTATEMTGTFEGAFYRHDLTTQQFGPDYTMLTNGEFKLKIN